MQVKPLGERLMVERQKAPEKIGNIIIPDTAREQQQVNRGTIKSVGPDVKCDLLKEGATVLFGHYSGNEVEIDRVKVLILAEEDVLAVLV